MFTDEFGDKRIDIRLNKLVEKLVAFRQSSINFISENSSERRSFYRILQNTSVTESSLLTPITQSCVNFCADKNIVVVNDTCEFNLTSHMGRLKKDSGLGKTANDDVLGFMLHGSLAIDFESGVVLGFSNIQLWDRGKLTTTKNERKYSQLSIEDKESYKWIASVNESEKVLQKAASITFVSDRESDIYNLFCCHKQAHVDYVIRNRVDRKTTTGKTIKDCLAATPELHSYHLEIQGDVRSNIKKHTAKMSLKWVAVEMAIPKKIKDKTLPKSISATAIEAKELDKEDGIHWIIITTKTINSIEDAMQVIQIYKYRWYIEQLHRLLKTEGFRIESSELESGYSIRKLTLLCLIAALKILQMMVANISTEDQNINLIFNEEEVACLEKIENVKYQPPPKNQKPKTTKYHPKTIKWAYAVIGKLGGWKDDNKLRKAGPITLQKGLIKFYDMFEGWKLSRI